MRFPHCGITCKGHSWWYPMIRCLTLFILLIALAGCTSNMADWRYVPGPNHSLATSDCTNGDPDLRQAVLGCPS